MRCNRRLFYVKVRSFLILFIALTSFVILVTVINHSPSLLKSVSYSVDLSFKYEQKPGGFLSELKPNNESYCTFNYDLPNGLRYRIEELQFSPEQQAGSSYRVLYNVLEARDALNGTAATASPMPQVTYATHVTPEFAAYISEIARSWEGAISVAAFVPDEDADAITRHLVHFCHCLPQMSRVSVHYVFPKLHPPYVQRWRSTPATCSLPESSSTYRARKQLSYPVNVARNVARQASATDYVMVSDVELVPSDKLAAWFAEMIAKYGTIRRTNYPSRVFVVPVFEVEKYEKIPRNKVELMRLVKDERALYFHRYTCSHCQKFPGLENWLQQQPEDTVKPFLAVRREYPFHRWEPIYIGTKNEPLYSEALSWEGKQDKMTQMLEMCLKSYRFVILDNAFLIHWPGVKRKSVDAQRSSKWRSPYLYKNTRQYNLILNNLAARYKKNAKCKLQ